MIATLAASLVLAPPPQGTWVATRLTPAALARRVDATMAKVSQRLLTFHLDYQTEKEGFAFSNCTGTIVSPGVFKLTLPLIRPNAGLGFMGRQVWVADGRRYAQAVMPDEPKPGPVASRPPAPAHPLSIWFAQFPSVILSGLGRPATTFQNLVADAARQGFSSTVQSRTMVFQGKTYHSNRLVLANKGGVRYEIVFDGDYNLPVSVDNAIPHGRSRWINVAWNPPKAPLTVKDISFRV